MPALLPRRLVLLPLLLLLLLLDPAYAQPTSLWAAISQNASFSVLSNCVRQADPAILALLNDTGGSQQLYTLFAPLDSAFTAAGTDATICPNGNRDAATAVVSYLVSSQTTPLPYLNQPFALPLKPDVPAAAALYVYSISKDAATSPTFPPILYVNHAQALSWERIPTTQGRSHYLVPLASPLTPPPGNGSLWDVLQAQPEFSTTVSLITAQLPDFQALLQASPDVISHKGYHTFFVPNNEAWTKLPPDRLARRVDDVEAIIRYCEVLITAAVGNYVGAPAFVLSAGDVELAKEQVDLLQNFQAAVLGFQGIAEVSADDKAGYGNEYRTMTRCM